MTIRELLKKIDDTFRPPHVKGPGGGGGSPDAVDDARAAGYIRNPQPGMGTPPNFRPIDYETKSDE
ncbi:MAG TPA: hypothetical protein VFA37_02760 [Gaiellaceae bacterium]|nr:hypothetical protein [Gaiellaceae bacterium]